MVNIRHAHKYADPNCRDCEGGGIVCTWDGESAYCLCVKTNFAEAEGEMLMELARGN